ncbi:MAG: hypothetical protein RR945_06685 [Erysipelotrichaceae bacterium]
MELTSQDLLHDFKKNYKELSQYQKAIERFAHYRILPIDIVPDIDRSEPVIEIFKQLNWISSSSYRNFLENDTYFISPFVILRHLLKASDSKYYIQNFKKYVIYDLKENYEENNSRLKELRFHWLNLKAVQNHYKEVFESETVNQLLSVSHSISNFAVIPFKYGGKKCLVFHEDPFASLDDLEKNFNIYKENFASIGITNFTSFINRVSFNCCYEMNNQGKLVIKEELKNIYKFHRTDSFDSIIKKCKLLIELVKSRSLEIQETYKSVNILC